MFAGVSSSSRATCPNQKCVDEIGDGTVKADRSAEVLQHFSSSFQTRLDRTIGFQAAVSDNSGGKHPESSHQQTVRSRCLRHIVTQTRQDKGVVYTVLGVECQPVRRLSLRIRFRDVMTAQARPIRGR